MTAAANALKTANIITEVDDVFYLTFHELKLSLSGETINPSIIIERKNAFEKQKALLPPRTIGKACNNCLDAENNVKVKDPSSNIASELKGIATFDGRVKGKIMLFLF